MHIVMVMVTLLEKAGLPSLTNRRLQDLAILIFKVKHGLCPKYISELFTPSSYNYHLRNSEFILPRFNTITYGKHSISYFGPKLWSKLPNEIRNITVLSKFKTQLCKLNLSQLISDDNCSKCKLCNS